MSRSLLGVLFLIIAGVLLVVCRGLVLWWVPEASKVAVGNSPVKSPSQFGPQVRSATAATGGRGVLLTFYLDRYQFRVDEPLVIELVTTNTTNEEIFLGMSADELQSIAFEVRYGNEIMPLTGYGADMLLQVRAASKNIAETLKPGEHRSDWFVLNRMVDMTRAGTYSVRFKRSLPPLPRRAGDRAAPESPEVLVSNEIQVQMTEPPRPGP